MNLFEIAAKIELDSRAYEQGIERAKNIGDGFAGQLKNGLASAARLAGAAMATMATEAGQAFLKLTTEAVKSYAQYEQLIGGVDTLFKESSQKLQEYASQAYLTAGMSANEYMETATSFAASLIQSLEGDTEKAADYADIAMRSMSDNANKMGTSLESLRVTYGGFAKQNFTMLDNLKLGYGGTKEEMQRLLDDAMALKEAQGEYAEYTIESFADIVEAIEVVQTEMGITGATAAEAASTIEGSAGAAKAAWLNLIAGIANPNANMSALVSQFADSAMVAGRNIAATVSNSIEGIKLLISEFVPVIQQHWPEIKGKVAELFGQLFGVDLLSGDSLTKIANFGFDLIGKMFSRAAEAAPKLIENLFGEKGLLSQDNLQDLVTGGVNLIAGMFSDLPKLFSALAEVAPDIISGLVQAFASKESVEALINLGYQIVKTIFSGELLNLLWAIVQGLLQGLTKSINSWFGYEVFTDQVTGTEGFYEDFLSGGTNYDAQLQAQANQTLMQAQMGNLGYTGDRLKTGDFTSAYTTYGAGAILKPVTTISDSFGYGELKVPNGWGVTVNQTVNINGGLAATPSEVQKASQKGLEAALR